MEYVSSGYITNENLEEFMAQNDINKNLIEEQKVKIKPPIIRGCF